MGGRSPVQQAGRRDRVRVDDSLHDRLGGEELFNDGRLRGTPPAPPSASPPPPHEWGGALSICLSIYLSIYLSSGGSRSSRRRPVVVSSSNWLVSSPQSAPR